MIVFSCHCLWLAVSLQRDLVPGGMTPGEKGTGWESRTDGAAVCLLMRKPALNHCALLR